MTDTTDTLARLSLVPDAFTGADLNAIADARATHEHGTHETEKDRLASMTVALLTDGLIAADMAYKRTVRRGVPEPLWTAQEVRNHREAVRHARTLVDGVRAALEARRNLHDDLPLIHQDRFDWTPTSPDIADAVFTDGPSHAHGAYASEGAASAEADRRRGALVSLIA